MSRRFFGTLVVAASLVGLAIFGVTPALATASAANPFAGAHPKAGPPLRHAKPAKVTPAIAPAAPSPWTPLTNQPPFATGTMLLQSDGTVLVHTEPPNITTGFWWRLTPDSKGSYANGTWTQIPHMPSGYTPLYFASAVLPDGRMIVEGGEYNGNNAVWTNKGAIYNPVTNSWHSVAPPPGWTNIGDAQSDVLANGTFMLAQACQNCTSPNGSLSTADALYNTAGGWTTLSGKGKNDPNDEEGWTLQPNGHLLTVDTWLTPTTEQFSPTTLSWSFAGDTVRSPVNAGAVEIGPQVEMPGGNVLVVGAGNGSEAPAPCNANTRAPTALYDYSTQSWKAGPLIPTVGGKQYDSADGPGSVLPDGDVLFDVSPCVYNAPIVFYRYHASTNTLTAVPDVPNAANDSTYYTRLLALPNGQVLFNDGSQMDVYSGGNSPNPAWRPTITGLSSGTLAPGSSYSLSGIQLAGLDQGAAYGDDVQDATNFPLVRITNVATGAVTYARTHNWTSVSVAPGSSSSTRFTLPSGTPAGKSRLVVVANGIASGPVTVTVS